MNLNFKAFVGALAMLSLASCSKNDVFDAQQAAANEIAQKKTTFENNFVAKYGQVAPTQSWDFSTNQQRLGTRGEGDQIEVKVLKEGLDFGIVNEYVAYNPNVLTTRTFTKNTALYDVLNNDLKDGTEHKGEPAVLLAPSTDFTIYPLSNQGGWVHKLYVKVGDKDPVMVYNKTWTFWGRATVNGDVTKLVNYNEVAQRAALPGVRIKAPIGTRVDVYIDYIAGTKGNIAGTTNGQAIYLDCNVKPEGISWLKDDAIIKYIGIEDDKSKASDLDFNDVVLAVVGNPYVPTKVTFTDETYDVPLSVTKRYMMEDLGSTDDFDFNDVVVDVTETTVAHHKVTLDNYGVIYNDEVVKTTKTQKAVVRHLGGTLPFVLKVGDTTFDEMGGKDTFDKDVEIEKVVTGWIPSENNVSVTVKDNTQGSTMYNVTNEFPKTGTFPMMFACDPEIEWAAERQKFNFKQFPGYQGE